MAKIITIEIGDDGGDIDLAGFHGKGCAAILEGFQKALGKATEVVKKPEYNKVLTTKTTITNRG